MKNRKLIRIFVAFFVLVTGMNSYADIFLCFHENGFVNIVTMESHSEYHGRQVPSKKSCTGHDEDKILHTHEECGGCFDLPILIKNLTLLNSKNKPDISILTKYNPALDSIIKNIVLESFKICLDKIPKIPGFGLRGTVILLI